MTAPSSSSYKKTTGEKILLIFSLILIMVGSILIFFLASGIFTMLLFGSLVVAGFVMHHYANRRVNQLKKKLPSRSGEND
jgi:ABC-type multidrug transport system fused ATPase/permease subunit